MDIYQCHHVSYKGYYLFMEASSPRKFNDTARLLSPSIAPGDYCFRFYYYMYGSDVYQLNAYVMEGDTKTQIFSEQGDIAQAWLAASIPVSRTQSYQVMLAGKEWIELWKTFTVLDKS